MSQATQQEAASKSTSELRAMVSQTHAQESRLDMFTMSGLQLAHKLAKTYASSNAVPAAFRDYVEKKDKTGTVLVENPNAIGNCIVAIETAESTGFSISAVMQNAHVIEGKLSWSAQFVIAAINASRRFTPLRFNLRNLGKIAAKYREKTNWNKEENRYNTVEKNIELENWECIAWAYPIENGIRSDEKIESIPVSMKMAVEEGWYAKNGSKWQTELKFQMLQYRAATFFGRLNAPDVLMGFGQTTEELQDSIIDVVPQADGTLAADIDKLRRTATTPAPRQEPDGVMDVEAKDVDDLSRQKINKDELNDPKVNDISINSTQNTQVDDGADYRYAMTLVEQGSFDEALDFARSMHPEDASEIRTMIEDKKKATEASNARTESTNPIQEPAPRRRNTSVNMGS